MNASKGNKQNYSCLIFLFALTIIPRARMRRKKIMDQQCSNRRSDDHVGYGYFARQEKCRTITKWDDAKDGPTQLCCYFHCLKHLTGGYVLLKFCCSYDKLAKRTLCCPIMAAIIITRMIIAVRIGLHSVLLLLFIIRIALGLIGSLLMGYQSISLEYRSYNMK